jgi:hypothetical protein
MKISRAALSQVIEAVFGVCAVERLGIISFQSCRGVNAASTDPVKPGKRGLGVAITSRTSAGAYDRTSSRTVSPFALASSAVIGSRSSMAAASISYPTWSTQ